MLTECHGSIGSFQSCTLLLLLLDLVVKLGSLGYGQCSYSMELEGKHGTCGGSFMFLEDRVDI